MSRGQVLSSAADDEVGEDAPLGVVLFCRGDAELASASEGAVAWPSFVQQAVGKNKDTIEQVIVHEWWKEEPLALGCERHAFALGTLAQVWPHLIEPVGRVHFAGAAYDNLPWGQDAATRSARRVTLAIDAA